MIKGCECLICQCIAKLCIYLLTKTLRGQLFGSINVYSKQQINSAQGGAEEQEVGASVKEVAAGSSSQQQQPAARDSKNYLFTKFMVAWNQHLHLSKIYSK
jgi:hypothetical protein